MPTLLHLTCEEYRKIVERVRTQLKLNEEIDGEAAHAAFYHIYNCLKPFSACGVLWMELNVIADNEGEPKRLRHLLDAPVPKKVYEDMKRARGEKNSTNNTWLWIAAVTLLTISCWWLLHRRGKAQKGAGKWATHRN